MKEIGRFNGMLSHTPESCLTVLQRPEGLEEWSKSFTISSHFPLLWTASLLLISSLRTLSRGEEGSDCRKASYSSASSAASVGNSGRMMLMRPLGIALRLACLTISTNLFSPQITFSGAEALAKRDSEEDLKSCQLALRKLV